jgi:hypothetical protein
LKKDWCDHWTRLFTLYVATEIACSGGVLSGEVNIQSTNMATYWVKNLKNIVVETNIFEVTQAFMVVSFSHITMVK